MNWERELALAAEARKLSEILFAKRTTASLKIGVIGGGRKGPFTVTVKRLGKQQVRKVINAILEALGDEPSEDLK